MKNQHGGYRKGAGRKTRSTSKSKPIWCGQMTKATRAAIMKLTPQERQAALVEATKKTLKP